MIGAANDVRNAHVDVVHNHAELVSWDAIGAQQNEILDLGVLYFSRTENSIFEFRHSIARHTKADRARNSVALAGSSVCVGEIAAGTSNALVGLWGVVAFTCVIFDLIDRSGVTAGICRGFAVASERRPVCEQAFRRAAVQVRSLGLKERTFVPLNSQPFEPFENPFDELGTIAFDVGVFDP
jgi:hypothetical protein